MWSESDSKLRILALSVSSCVAIVVVIAILCGAILLVSRRRACQESESKETAAVHEEVVHCRVQARRCTFQHYRSWNKPVNFIKNAAGFIFQFNAHFLQPPVTMFSLDESSFL